MRKIKIDGAKFSSRFQVPNPNLGWFELGPSVMQEQLHYFKPLHHKDVETDLRLQKNIKLGTINSRITLKCEFSINTRME